MVTLTNEEWDILNSEERKAHLRDEEKTVFGADVKHKGKVPLEQGVGSPGRETGNHFTAIRKYEGEDAWKAACNELHKRDPDRAKKLGLPKHAVA